MGLIKVILVSLLVLAVLGFLGTVALFNTNPHEAELRWQDKYSILKKLQEQHSKAVLPMTVVPPNKPVPSLETLSKQDITLPIAAKPNFGTAEGIGFMPLRDEGDFRAFSALSHKFPRDYILQPYLGDYEVELRIAAHRFTKTPHFTFDKVVVVKSAVYSVIIEDKDSSRPYDFRSKEVPEDAVRVVPFPESRRESFSRELANAYPGLRFLTIDAMAPSLDAFQQHGEFKILEINGGLGFSRMPHQYRKPLPRLGSQIVQGVKFWGRRVGHGLKHTIQHPIRALKVFQQSFNREKNKHDVAAEYNALKAELKTLKATLEEKK